MKKIIVQVRSGGGVLQSDGSFSDVIEIVERVPKVHERDCRPKGRSRPRTYRSVRYKGKRYKVCWENRNGVRSALFIDLSSMPIYKPVRPFNMLAEGKEFFRECERFRNETSWFHRD